MRAIQETAARLFCDYGYQDLGGRNKDESITEAGTLSVTGFIDATFGFDVKNLAEKIAGILLKQWLLLQVVQVLHSLSTCCRQWSDIC